MTTARPYERLAQFPFVALDEYELIEHDWGSLHVSERAKGAMPVIESHPNASGNVVVILGAFSGRIKIHGRDNLCILIGDQAKTSLLTLYFWGRNSTFSFGPRSTSNGFTAEFTNEDVITIGEDCMFAAEILLQTTDRHAIIDTEGHIVNRPQPIHIRDHVWISRRVIVLKGVEIGNGSIVAIGAIVTKSIPPCSIAAGNPAKIVRENVTWTRSPTPHQDERTKARDYIATMTSDNDN